MLANLSPGTKQGLVATGAVIFFVAVIFAGKPNYIPALKTTAVLIAVAWLMVPLGLRSRRSGGTDQPLPGQEIAGLHLGETTPGPLNPPITGNPRRLVLYLMCLVAILAIPILDLAVGAKGLSLKNDVLRVAAPLLFLGGYAIREYRRIRTPRR